MSFNLQMSANINATTSQLKSSYISILISKLYTTRSIKKDKKDKG